MAVEPLQTSEDSVLGGRLVLRQPLKGHRFGHDAILLAAACSVRPGDRLVDLGAGVGAAGLAVARRVEDVIVTMVEIDPVLFALARENAAQQRPRRADARSAPRRRSYVCSLRCRGARAWWGGSRVDESAIQCCPKSFARPQSPVRSRRRR